MPHKRTSTYPNENECNRKGKNAQTTEKKQLCNFYMLCITNFRSTLWNWVTTSKAVCKICSSLEATVECIWFTSSGFYCSLFQKLHLYRCCCFFMCVCVALVSPMFNFFSWFIKCKCFVPFGVNVQWWWLGFGNHEIAFVDSQYCQHFTLSQRIPFMDVARCHIHIPIISLWTHKFKLKKKLFATASDSMPGTLVQHSLWMAILPAK